MTASPIAIISLERAADRRRFMDARMKEVGLSYDFFDAVDGRLGTGLGRYDRVEARRFFGKELTPGEQGCFASHYLLWRRCAASRTPLIVMEDDVRPTLRFREAAALAGQLLEQRPMVRLYGLRRRARSTLVADMGGGFSLIRYLRGPAGTQCYAISPAGAEALLRGASSWREPVDRYIDRFWEHGIASLALLPFQLSGAGRDAFPSAVESWARPGRASASSRLIRLGDHIRRHAYNLRLRLGASSNAT